MPRKKTKNAWNKKKPPKSRKIEKNLTGLELIRYKKAEINASVCRELGIRQDAPPDDISRLLIKYASNSFKLLDNMSLHESIVVLTRKYGHGAIIISYHRPTDLKRNQLSKLPSIFLKEFGKILISLQKNSNINYNIQDFILSPYIIWLPLTIVNQTLFAPDRVFYCDSFLSAHVIVCVSEGKTLKQFDQLHTKNYGCNYKFNITNSELYQYFVNFNDNYRHGLSYRDFTKTFPKLCDFLKTEYKNKSDEIFWFIAKLKQYGQVSTESFYSCDQNTQQQQSIKTENEKTCKNNSANPIAIDSNDHYIHWLFPVGLVDILPKDFDENKKQQIKQIIDKMHSSEMIDKILQISKQFMQVGVKNNIPEWKIGELLRNTPTIKQEHDKLKDIFHSVPSVDFNQLCEQLWEEKCPFQKKTKNWAIGGGAFGLRKLSRRLAGNTCDVCGISEEEYNNDQLKKNDTDEQEGVKINTNKMKLKTFMCCSGCNLRWYCSRECQKKDWIQHKKTCKSEVSHQFNFNSYERFFKFSGAAANESETP